MHLPNRQNRKCMHFQQKRRDESVECRNCQRQVNGTQHSCGTSDRELSWVRFPARVATVALGSVGAILAVTGIFGMAAYGVRKRMRELGIRVALGLANGKC
jgi:hypothetical protein